MSQASLPSSASPEPSPADKPQLTYAPAPSRRRRRIRRAILAILLLGVLGIGYYWRAPLWAHAQLIYWQHAAASFTFPADKVVATTNRSAAAAKIPAAWLHYESLAPAPLFKSSNIPATIAFLHARKSPGGHERIVAIRCTPTYLGSATILQSLQAVVVQPAGLWDLQSRPQFKPGIHVGGYPVFMPINLYAGQIDPSSESHFTLAYTINGKRGTIDGWLDDNDVVKMEVRPGSADMMSEHHPATKPE